MGGVRRKEVVEVVEMIGGGEVEVMGGDLVEVWGGYDEWDMRGLGGGKVLGEMMIGLIK